MFAVPCKSLEALDQGYFRSREWRPQPSGWGTFSETTALSATLHDFLSKQDSSADAAQTALPQKAGTGTHDTSHVHGASTGVPALGAGQAALST